MNIDWNDRLGMRVGVHYLVTHDSVDQEFQRGDHIWLCADGSIMCFEAQGWMEAEDLPAATRGMTVEVDTKWLGRKREQLTAQLEALDT